MATAAPITTSADPQWHDAMHNLEEAEAAYNHFEKTVWDPVYEQEKAFELGNGLVSPGMGRDSTPNYHQKRIALKEAHPDQFTPDQVHEEGERLSLAYCDAQNALMQLEAPDLYALRWKLDHILDLGDADEPKGGSTPSWSGRYVRQALTDITRLLPARAK